VKRNVSYLQILLKEKGRQELMISFFFGKFNCNGLAVLLFGGLFVHVYCLQFLVVRSLRPLRGSRGWPLIGAKSEKNREKVKHICGACTVGSSDFGT
jgi:hypothetical protein